MGLARSRMPPDAPTDRRKPSEPTSRGSTRRSPVTARARMRTPDTGRPRVEDSRARPAMASARSTDGSHRVRTPKRSSRTRPAPKRGPSRSRRRRGESRARTKATFWPLTTNRWVRPAARKSSVISTGWPRSSPRTKPEKRVRRSGGRDATPDRRVRRIAVGQPAGAVAELPPADLGHHQLGGHVPAVEVAPGRRRAPAASGPPAPPARPPAGTGGGPRRHRGPGPRPVCPGCARRPAPRRRRRTGRVTRVAVPRHWPTTGGRNPASARHPRVEASRAAPRITTAGRRATSPARATAATGSSGSRTDAHAPAAVASAIATTAVAMVRRPWPATVRAGSHGLRLTRPSPGDGSPPAWPDRSRAPRAAR